VSDFWIQTYSGKAFDLAETTIESINIVDIAHSLSMQCRFNGHVREFYSVAEHSVRVSVAVEHAAAGQHDSIELALWGLMHDASEAYVGDLVLPLKSALRCSASGQHASEYDRHEKRVQQMICAKFGLPLVEPEIVKRMDKVLLLTEKRDLLGSGEREWNDLGIAPLRNVIVPVEPRRAYQDFLDRFDELIELAGIEVAP
jgi:5'-deoxynucleotidase YfbR-like HD superfamily hydrolase